MELSQYAGDWCHTMRLHAHSVGLLNQSLSISWGDRLIEHIGDFHSCTFWFFINLLFEGYRFYICVYIEYVFSNNVSLCYRVRLCMSLDTRKRSQVQKCTYNRRAIRLISKEHKVTYSSRSTYPHTSQREKKMTFARVCRIVDRFFEHSI